MPRLVEYQCHNCGEVSEEIFGDTESQPKYREANCPKCGSSMIRSWNVKKNSQCWRHNDRGGV
jgi:DNA-directed RNA polymerase subunit RPC12/RpoP